MRPGDAATSARRDASRLRIGRRATASQANTVGYSGRVKIMGKRRRTDDTRGMSPEEALRRAAILQAQADRLNPFPRPRGFVLKARTWEEYERWRRAQMNPRLW